MMRLRCCHSISRTSIHVATSDPYTLLKVVQCRFEYGNLRTRTRIFSHPLRSMQDKTHRILPLSDRPLTFRTTSASQASQAISISSAGVVISLLMLMRNNVVPPRPSTSYRYQALLAILAMDFNRATLQTMPRTPGTDDVSTIVYGKPAVQALNPKDYLWQVRFRAVACGHWAKYRHELFPRAAGPLGLTCLLLRILLRPLPS